MKQTIMIALVLFVAGISPLFSQGIESYLITSNIENYRYFLGESYRGKLIGGPTTFTGGNEAEGTYIAYEATYGAGEEFAAPSVEVRVMNTTQWLEHNLQGAFRDTVDDDTLGLRDPSSVIEKIGNSRVFTAFSGGGAYAWLHNNLWIEINYMDLQLVEPEPLEVVEAYLQKWPPTYPTESTKLIAGTEQWIKDEMEYLLWSSERWFVQYDAGKETLKEAMWEVKDKLDDFLRYRAKYFDENLDEERIAVKNADETSLRAKLKEYQQWLAENKDKALVGL